MNIRTKIPIPCSLARNLFFSYSRKKINLYSYIHFISIPYFFTIHVISVKHTLISNYYKKKLAQIKADSRERTDSRVFAARTQHGLSSRTTTHTHTRTHVSTLDVDEDSASSPAG